jgi:hypothetical protein
VTIQGKIAAVISSREIAINVGRADGVHADDIVTVFSSIEVKDPDSKEVLGSVKRPKVRLRIREVQEHLAVAESYEQVANSGLDVFRQANVVKSLTDEPAAANYRTVLVRIGESVEVGAAPPPPKVPKPAF